MSILIVLILLAVFAAIRLYEGCRKGGTLDQQVNAALGQRDLP